MIKKTFYFISIIIFLSACSPSVYQLSTIDEAYSYAQGKQVIMKEDSNAVLFLNFERQKGDHFVIYVEAVNKTELAYLLNPASIRMELIQTNSNRYKPGGRFYANDPELELRRLAEDKDNLETTHAVTQGLHGLIAIVEVVSDIAANDGDEAIYDAAKWGAVIHDEEIEHDYESDEIARAEYHWQNEVLRSTTLYKDDRIGGIVYMPFDKEAEIVSIVVPFGNSEYRFLYEQRELD